MLVVTTAATDRALLTAAEARAAIGDDAADATKITALLNRVSSAITRTCRVPAGGAVPPTLRRETLTETFRLKSYQEHLVLSRRPIVSVTSIVEDDTTLASDDYEINAATGMLLRLDDSDEPSEWLAAKIVVVYVAGWETVPDDLKLAAVKLAALFWSEGERVDANLKSESIPGVIDQEFWVSPASDPLIPEEVKQLLVPYMNHWIG